MTTLTLTSLGPALALVAAVCSGSDAHADTALADEPLITTVAVDERELAPDSELAMFDGSSATFADYGGRPLVANSWASWCPIIEAAVIVTLASRRTGRPLSEPAMSVDE